MVIFTVVFFLAAAFSLILTPLVAGLGVRVGIVDYPGVRKLHMVAIPRAGGAGIATALTLTIALVLAFGEHLVATPVPDLRTVTPILPGAVLVFLVGFCDDLVGLSPGTKLLGQVTAACAVMATGIVIDRVTLFGTVYELAWLSVPATLLWIVSITNAFNLVDGVDGLAGGLICIAASTCAAVLLIRGDHAEALLLVAFLGATVGFLGHNFSPAEVFLGDSGSLLCGFLLAVTAIAGRQKSATALAVGVPLLIFALPLADTCYAIVRRLIHCQSRSHVNVWERVCALTHVLMADQAHIHHRLIARGLSHRRAVLLLYALAILCSVIALVSMEHS
jgi:UDP-GlcNAc:undecaprenyl-phosphate GlcNAc-1-phosphate transferase